MGRETTRDDLKLRDVQTINYHARGVRVTVLCSQGKRLADACRCACRVSHTPAETLQFTRITDRSISWLVGSALADARRLAVAVLVVAAGAAACTRSPESQTASAADRPLTRGGELVASQRTEPANYNRYFEAAAAAELLAQLTHAKLVKVNRATDELEPALAESWSTTDGVTYTLKLRPNVRFSDGTPFTSGDVLFSFSAAYDAPGSQLAQVLKVGDKRLTVSSSGPETVTVTFPERYAPALRLLDNLPILPKHKLEAALNAKAMREAWTPSRPVSEIAGLGPFVLTEHTSGQRMVLMRNPHYWRRDAQGTQLPYLDRITLVLVDDQSVEALRLEAGAIDVMANADLQPERYLRFKQLASQGRLQLIDGGPALDANVLWFNLAASPERKPWMQKREFRQALSYAVDRQAIANAVYFGAATPVYGPITPRNSTWIAPSTPTYPYDRAKSVQLLAAIGLHDRNADGLLDDAAGRPVRFSILLRQGSSIRERTATLLQDQWKAVGVGVDIVGLDMSAIVQRWQKHDYDTIFHGFDASTTDPATNLDFWLSSGTMHFWNPAQQTPASDWERRIDELMRQQASLASLPERQRLFAEVQRIFGEELPALYFVVPKLTFAASSRVKNLRPAPQNPHFLWSADTIAVSGPAQNPR
jgi:peptide/nickel transport system substrate-binding protein